MRAKPGSANVVGMIEGSDAKLKSGYVVFTARLDHLGIRQGMMADNLHNGALDDATGVASSSKWRAWWGRCRSSPDAPSCSSR